ncbi:MAG: hypothetical protein A2720_03365 [Candidatus Doudnabacteria bacterium RIFCSPHIGHO2_01_FULL_46_24]|uniref:Homing endonuclease LAGLIDADG domain-containing protein n=1 Tax=Candidatus Doudnabacteria bacterium RIFCSPHIGHO2_01_FULL_46_24 TaxID=1817825 RepID=A0A1F5NUD6_9BACT|nr:MAG: hypothetical protein A2720_03365 [Candidatus Doudnabacteria bacterium RIFCSPHIGHO2_01_FULL_46_24]
MMQIKKRRDGKIGLRFMCTICFYQDTRHEKDLFWIRMILGIGYISRRNDGMTELRINGFKQVRDILKMLLPFIRFKKVQAEALYKAAEILCSVKFTGLSQTQLKELVSYVMMIQSHNYVTRHKRTESELLLALGLTP